MLSVEIFRNFDGVLTIAFGIDSNTTIFRTLSAGNFLVGMFTSRQWTPFFILFFPNNIERTASYSGMGRGLLGIYPYGPFVSTVAFTEQNATGQLNVHFLNPAVSSSDITYNSSFPSPESKTDALWLKNTFFLGRCSRTLIRRPVQGFPIFASNATSFSAGSFTTCLAVSLAKSFDETVMAALYLTPELTYTIDLIFANGSSDVTYVPKIYPINVTTGKVVMSPTNDTFCYIVANTEVYYECRRYTSYEIILGKTNSPTDPVLDVAVAFSVDGKQVAARFKNWHFVLILISI